MTEIQSSHEIPETNTTNNNLPLHFVQFIRKNEPEKRLGIVDFENQQLHPFPEGTFGDEMINLIKQDFTEVIMNVKTKPPEPITNNIKFLPPISNPEKIICCAFNYTDYCLDRNIPKPTEVTFFNKLTNTLIGHEGHVIAHKIANKIDYEVELAFIIGKKAKNVSKQDALDYVFGYTVAQDIAARDWQLERNGGQFLIAKSMDTFCPMGPAIVHKNAIKNAHNLHLSTKINGEEKQNSNTSKMIFKIPHIIHEITRCITLNPGDIILTGSPTGCGITRNPQIYLQVGDIIETKIQNVGKLVTKLIADTAKK